MRDLARSLARFRAQAYANYMEPDDGPWQVCATLAAQFCNADGTDRWRVWPGEGNGLFYAWYIDSSPPVVLRDRHLSGLRERMEEFERSYAQTGDWAVAMSHAERLDT